MGKVIMSGIVEPLTKPIALPPVGKALNEYTWEEVSLISQAGKAADYFAVGDTKSIVINGTVGTLTVNATYNVFILGIDHNADVEGKGIHFGCFKTSDGVDVALVDSRYNGAAYSSDYANSFYMNNSSNNNGWESCDMRKIALGNEGTPDEPTEGSLLNALPVELRSVVKAVTKYTDNIGEEKSNEVNITGTSDYIFLLAEFEIFGTRTYANTYEQNKQKQYDYYAAGNSKMKYKHNAPTSLVFYWLRSPSVRSNFLFCYVKCATLTGATVEEKTSYYSYGVAPAFVV